MGVPDSMSASEAVGPGSTPGRATCDNCRGMNFATFNRHGQVVASMPCKCDGRTVVFGTTRRGSTPWRGTAKQHVLGVCRIAREPAKLVDQVRFLAGTLSRRWSQTARQPAATRSKWVRLPPASLTVQLPVQTTSSWKEALCPNHSFVGWS